MGTITLTGGNKRKSILYGAIKHPAASSGLLTTQPPRWPSASFRPKGTENRTHKDLILWAIKGTKR